MDVLPIEGFDEDPKYRQGFLERVPLHMRTLALAKEWLQEEAS